jgi:hypothetical protein
VKFVIVDDDEISYHSLLDPKTIAALQDLLREAHCFAPSFADVDPYSVETYIVQFARYGNEVRLLIDRNIYSQVLALAKGDAVTEQMRVAAGVMAFASCANAQIEPGLALYEGSASGALGGWKNDLGLFQGADRIHPGHWAALALGRAQKFERRIARRRLQSDITKRFDPAMKLKPFEFVYPILLKMASICRAAGSPDSKMLVLIDWIYDSWQFSAPAMILASNVLSQDPPRKVFKNIGSNDRMLALLGVKNAAWDLVYLTEWHKAIKVQSATNALTVLCSCDVLLLKVAEQLRVTLFAAEEVCPLQQAGFGRRVLERYAMQMADLGNPRRALAPFPDDFKAYRKRLVSDLEAEVLRPMPLRL